MADELLLRKLRERDDGAFREILRRYQPALQRYALAHVENPSLAAEVVQETWAQAIAEVEHFDGQSGFKTWLFRILVDRARHHMSIETRFGGEGSRGIHRRTADLRHRRGVVALLPMPWQENSPDEEIHRREVMAGLEREISNLSATRRTVVIMHDVEGARANDVCKQLGISPSNVRVLLHRARSQLRLALEKKVLAPSSMHEMEQQ